MPEVSRTSCPATQKSVHHVPLPTSQQLQCWNRGQAETKLLELVQYLTKEGLISSKHCRDDSLPACQSVQLGKLLPAHGTFWVVTTSATLLHMCRAMVSLILSFLAFAGNECSSMAIRNGCWVLQFKPHTYPAKTLHCSFWGITKDGCPLVWADLLHFSFDEMANYLSTLWAAMLVVQ